MIVTIKVHGKLINLNVIPIELLVDIIIVLSAHDNSADLHFYILHMSKKKKKNTYTSIHKNTLAYNRKKEKKKYKYYIT